MSLKSLSALTRVADLPEYVKSASATYPDDLPRQAFADRDGREYPVHSQAATYISCVNFYSSGKKNAKIEAQLRKSAKYFDIVADVAAAENAVKAAGISVVAKQAYALEIGGDKLFPISTPNQIKASAEAFCSRETLAKLPHQARKSAAVNILAAAGNMKAYSGIPDLEYLCKAAAVGPRPRADVLGWLRRRVDSYTANVGEMEKLAAEGADMDTLRKVRDENNPYIGILRAVEATENMDHAFVAKLASAIDAADRLLGNQVNYAGGWLTPEEICYTGEVEIPKVVVKAAGVERTMEDIRKSSLTIDDFAPLGTAFTDRIKTANSWRASQKGIDYAALAVAASELGRDDQKLLAEVLKGV